MLGFIELDRLPDHCRGLRHGPRTAASTPPLTKLNPAGSALVYSTYLGGQDFDGGGGLASTAPATPTSRGGTVLDELPDHARRVRHHARRQRRLRDEAQPGRLGAGVLDAASAAARPTRSAASPSTRPATPGSTGGTTSADFPVTAGRRRPHLQRRRRRLHRRAERRPARRCSTPPSSAARSPRARTTSPATPPATSTSPATRSRMDFPVTVGAFDTVWNGDPTIFWGDAFVTKLDLDATTSTPPAPPAVPAAPTLLAPSNGSSPAAADQLRLERRGRARRRTRSRSTTRARFTAPLVRDADASRRRSTRRAASPTTTHFWRVRGVNSAGVAGAWSRRPAASAPGRRRRRRADEPRHQPDDGRRRQRLQRHRDRERRGAATPRSSPCRAATRRSRASRPPSRCRPAASPGPSRSRPHRSRAPRRVVDHGDAQRHDPASATLTVTPRQSPPTSSLQNLVLSPSSVTGGTDCSGSADARRARRPDAAPRSRCRAATRRWQRAGERDGRPGGARRRWSPSRPRP